MIELSEADILRQILDYLSVHRIMHWRQNVGSRVDLDRYGKKRFIKFGRKGAADIFACVNGMLVAIEVKDAKGRQSEHQRAFEQEVIAAGGIYILCRSLEDMVENLPLPKQQKLRLGEKDFVSHGTDGL